jgi:hypothetical protein
MYITNLCAGKDNDITVIENPTWKQVRKAIFTLNGYDCTTVTLGKDYEDGRPKGDIKEFMSIAGGGKNGLYVCDFYSYEGEYRNDNYEGEHGELTLLDLSKSCKKETEIIRVFPTSFILAACLDIEPILVAAKTYSYFGRLDRSLQWGYFRVLDSSEVEIIEVK